MAVAKIAGVSVALVCAGVLVLTVSNTGTDDRKEPVSGENENSEASQNRGRLTASFADRFKAKMDALVSDNRPLKRENKKDALPHGRVPRSAATSPQAQQQQNNSCHRVSMMVDSKDVLPNAVKPQELNIYRCVGQCDNRTLHDAVASKLLGRNNCRCAAVSFEPVQFLVTAPAGLFVTIDIPDLRVKECGCS